MAKTIYEEIKQTKPFVSGAEEVVVNINRTFTALNEKQSAFFKEYGITGQQYNVLRILRGAGGEGLPSLEVANRMLDRLPDITRLLERMSNNGLIIRTRCDNDRRVVRVSITDQGLFLLRETDKPLDDLNKRLLQYLSVQELKKLSALLDKARDSITTK